MSIICEDIDYGLTCRVRTCPSSSGGQSGDLGGGVGVGLLDVKSGGRMGQGARCPWRRNKRTDVLVIPCRKKATRFLTDVIWGGLSRDSPAERIWVHLELNLLALLALNTNPLTQTLQSSLLVADQKCRWRNRQGEAGA
jgi:hypothetical protein